MLLLNVIFALVATWYLMKSCDGFETAADYLGRNLGEGMKGATINAIGSSMPELLVTFIYLFIYNDTTGFAGGIATTAGSAVYNSMIIPAVVILAVIWKRRIDGVEVSPQVLIRDGIILLFAEALLIVTMGNVLDWYHGAMLMGVYAAYAMYMIRRHRSQCANDDILANTDEEDYTAGGDGDRILAFFKGDVETGYIGEEQELSDKKAWGLLAIATSYIALACWLLVHACESIGQEIGIHGFFVAVIVAAAASSVPDTILSFKDAAKGNDDDAMSNALGSNIFDICFALGLPLFIYTLWNGAITIPADIADDIVELRVLLFILTLAAFFIFISGQKMGRLKALMLIGLYGFFFAFVFGRAYEADWASAVASWIHSIYSLIA